MSDTLPSRRELRLARQQQEHTNDLLDYDSTGPMNIIVSEDIESQAQHPATGPSPSIPSTHPVHHIPPELRRINQEDPGDLPEPISAESLIHEEHSGDATYDEIYPPLDPIEDEDAAVDSHNEVVGGEIVRVTNYGPHGPYSSHPEDDPHFDDTNPVPQPTQEQIEEGYRITAENELAAHRSDPSKDHRSRPQRVSERELPDPSWQGSLSDPSTFDLRSTTSSEKGAKYPGTQELSASELDREARKHGIRPLSIVRTNGTISVTTLATLAVFIGALMNALLALYGTSQIIMNPDSSSVASSSFAFTVGSSGIAIVLVILGFALMSAKEESER